MAILTTADEEVAAAYKACKAKQFGTVHERMKYVIEVLRTIRDAQEGGFGGAFDREYMELATGIFDLETEVKYTRPTKPPYGTRAMPRNRRG